MPLGKVPHNKGKESERKLRRIQMVREGKAIECKLHGIHLEWRIHSQNNVQCRRCAGECQKRRNIQYPFKSCLRNAKRHSKKYGETFVLSENYLNEISIKQKNKCKLSGIEFDEKNVPSIDRIDSKKGYIKENVQLVIYEINRMKSNLDQNRFIELCKNVAKKGKK